MVQKPIMIQQFMKINKYGRPGTKRKKTTKIAWHFTGQHDVSAKNTVSYFSNVVANGYRVNGRYIYASSHLVMGLSGEVYHIIPFDEIAYTTNDANYYSIGVECATTGSDDHYTDEEYVSMVKTGAWLAQTYKLDPRKDFIRHYDVTRKVCPRYFVNHKDKWEQFKLDCYNYMIGKLLEKNIRNCTNGKGNSIIKDANIGEPAPPINPLGIYKVIADVLNVRKGASTSYDKVGTLNKGEQITITKIDGQWGYVEEKDGWISLAYTKFIKEMIVDKQVYNRKAKVVGCTILNVRDVRPDEDGVLGKIKFTLNMNDVVKIGYSLNGWCSVYTDTDYGFVNKKYLEFV